MHAAILYIKMGAGVWAVSRAIRWGIPQLIPQKIKSVYDEFLNSEHKSVVQIRLGLATVYDLLPITLPLAYYKSSHGQNNLFEYTITIDLLLTTCWMVAFGCICLIAEQQRYPTAAGLASRIQPWLEPTGFSFTRK